MLDVSDMQDPTCDLQHYIEVNIVKDSSYSPQLQSEI